MPEAARRRGPCVAAHAGEIPLGDYEYAWLNAESLRSSEDLAVNLQLLITFAAESTRTEHVRAPKMTS